MFGGLCRATQSSKTSTLLRLRGSCNIANNACNEWGRCLVLDEVEAVASDAPVGLSLLMKRHHLATLLKE